MLIEFTVGNFRSIKEPVTLSMVAANLVSKDRILDRENVIEVEDDLRLLKSAAIYGANASGKSNIATAIQFMRSFILNSSRETQLQDKIRAESFRLSTETENAPSFFQMVFLLDEKKYRYGFEVTPQRVTAEWLFFVPSSREAKLFERELEHIKVYERFKEGRGVEEKTRANALFLSVVAQFNGDIAGKILAWFDEFKVNLGVDDDIDIRLATHRFHELEDKKAFLRLIKDLDLGISDIHSEQEAVPWSADTADAVEDKILRAIHVAIEGVVGSSNISTETTKIRTVHQKYDSQGKIVEPEIFELDAQESAGTRRLFSLALPILDALEAGHVLFIDEIDARLHPLITYTIIGLFNSKRSNPKNAQLIFTTHDTNLLNNKRFRRDQIWFVEKDRFGATHLYSLAEFKIRNDASFEQDYIGGKYGAIPFITSDLEWSAGSTNGNE